MNFLTVQINKVTYIVHAKKNAWENINLDCAVIAREVQVARGLGSATSRRLDPWIYNRTHATPPG